MNKATTFAVFSCLFGSIVDQTAPSAAENHTENCTSWPSGLKTLAECCVIPHHSDYNAEEGCERDCYGQKDYKGGILKCVLDCYIGKGTLLMRYGKISTTTVARLYERESYYLDGSSEKWKEIIAAGVTSCHFESNGTLKENLAKYFNCIDDYLTENCIQFKNTEECFKVYNHVEDCKSPLTDCSKWPENLTFSANCCNMPHVFENISSNCFSSCAKKELLPIPQNNCAKLCDSLETGLLTSDGILNVDKLRKNLQESERFSEKWNKQTDDAIETCKTEVKGWSFLEIYFKSTIEYFTGLTNLEAVTKLEKCIQYNFLTHCVDFQCFLPCFEQTRYMTRCPNTKPPK